MSVDAQPIARRRWLPPTPRKRALLAMRILALAALIVFESAAEISSRRCGRGRRSCRRRRTGGRKPQRR